MARKQNSGATNRTIKKLKEELAAVKHDQELINKTSVEKDLERKKNNDRSLKSWQLELMRKQNSAYLLDNLPTTPEEIHAVLELPVYGTNPEAKVSAINAIRQQQRQGYYYQPAIFADAILQDPVISSALNTRIKAITGKPIKFEPADDSELAKTICEDIEKNFAVMCPISEIEEMLHYGLLLGTSIQQIMWDTSSGRWMPTLQSFHPKYLTWNYAWYQFQLTTASGFFAVLPDSPQWNLFFPFTKHLPWSRGYVLPLAMLWLIGNCNEQWWSQHQEKNGQGLLVAITSAEATPAQEKAFAQQLFNLQTSPVVRAPQGEDGNKFDVRREDPASDLYEGFRELLDYRDRRVFMLMLGQDKTAMTKSGINIGGQDAGENVRLDLQRSDNVAVCSNIREHLLKLFVKYNYGDNCIDLTPTLTFDIEPKEDMKLYAESLKFYGEAMEKIMAQPGSEEIDFRALRERFNIPRVEGPPPVDVPEYYSDAEALDDPDVIQDKKSSGKRQKNKKSINTPG